MRITFTILINIGDNYVLGTINMWLKSNHVWLGFIQGYFTLLLSLPIWSVLCAQSFMFSFLGSFNELYNFLNWNRLTS